MPKAIVAIGGGEIRTRSTLDIDLEIIRLSNKRRPKIVFIPTASSDSPRYCRRFSDYFGGFLDCKTDALFLVSEQPRQERSSARSCPQTSFMLVQKMLAVDLGSRPDHVLTASYSLPQKQYASTGAQWRRAFRSSRTSNAFDLASMSGWLVPVCSRSRGPHCSLQRCSVMTISPPLVPWNRSHQEAGKQKGHPNIRWPVPLSFRNLKVPHIEQPLAAQGTVTSLDARLSGSALRLNRS